MCPTSIRFLPWTPWMSQPAILKSHPLIGTTLSIFHKSTRFQDFSSHYGPLTPLYNNHDFLPGLGNNALRLPNTNKPLLTTHCFNNNQFKDLTEIKADADLPELPMCTYFQICSYLNHAPTKTAFSRQLTALETICLAEEPISKANSLTYVCFQDGSCPREDGLRERWSKELGITLTEKQWLKACTFAHKCSLSTRTQETAYKLLTLWYATPVKLHSWFPQTPDTCWRCHKHRGSLLHIWWQCPILQPFWSEVKKLALLITDTKLKLDALCCLLHVTEFSIKKYKYSLSIC